MSAISPEDKYTRAETTRNTDLEQHLLNINLLKSPRPSLRRLAIKQSDEENSNSTIDKDIIRFEEKWTDENEKLLRKWRDDALNNSKLHGKKARKYNVLYNLFGLPSCLIPIILSIIEPYLEIKLLFSIILCIVGVLNGILLFFDFSKKKTLHFEYEAKYCDYSLNLDAILCKKKQFRQSFDVVLTESLMEIIHLSDSAPVI